jgi:hypothetical protein
MKTANPRALAEKIFAWSEAGVDAFTITMLTADCDRAAVRAAMKIVREELIPAAAEAEADEGFRRRGRYLNAQELGELRAAGEARRAASEGDLNRFMNKLLETLTGVIADHPGADEVELERRFRQRLARRATH